MKDRWFTAYAMGQGGERGDPMEGRSLGGRLSPAAGNPFGGASSGSWGYARFDGNPNRGPDEFAKATAMRGWAARTRDLDDERRILLEAEGVDLGAEIPGDLVGHNEDADVRPTAQLFERGGRVG